MLPPYGKAFGGVKLRVPRSFHINGRYSPGVWWDGPDGRVIVLHDFSGDLSPFESAQRRCRAVVDGMWTLVKELRDRDTEEDILELEAWFILDPEAMTGTVALVHGEERDRNFLWSTLYGARRSAAARRAARAR